MAEDRIVTVTEEITMKFFELCRWYQEHGWETNEKWIRDQLVLVLNGITDARIHDNFIALASEAKWRIEDDGEDNAIDQKST